MTPLSVNVRGTQYLLEAVAGAHPRARVLIPGSALIYKPSAHAIAENDPIGPVSPYGVSKLAQEMLGRQCADTGTAVLLTRSFTHLGPGQAPGLCRLELCPADRTHRGRSHATVHRGRLADLRT